MQRGRRRGLFFAGATILLATSLPAAAQAPAPKPGATKTPQVAPPRTAGTESSSDGCQRARERAGQLRAELEAGISPAAKAAAERYVSSNTLAPKAWGDFAAAALLLGNPRIAAWAGLKAVEVRWTGETVTNAGIYLFHAGKTGEALQLLGCAYEMGYRSPYLFEALALVHRRQGNTEQAKQEICRAQEMAPNDPLIEVECIILRTGQPPPPRPPQRDPDGLDEALRELEEHAQRARNLIQAQADVIDRHLPDALARQYAQISFDLFTNMVQAARDQVRTARAADPSLRPTMINNAFAACIGGYTQITDHLLSFPASARTNGTGLLFWAEVLGLDPGVLARETGEWGSSPWSGEGAGAIIALAYPAFEEYQRDRDAGDRDHMDRLHACESEPCIIRENARWCGAWKQLYERWSEKSQQRHNTAARAYDRVATRRLIEAGNEILRLRGYVVRQVPKMRFPQTPGANMQEAVLQSYNASIGTLYQDHLSPSAGDFSVVSYLRGQAAWFEEERAMFEQWQAQEGEQMRQQCEPARRALLELLAQEEWQAYLEMLRDRLGSHFEAEITDDIPCEAGAGVGPIEVEYGTDRSVSVGWDVLENEAGDSLGPEYPIVKSPDDDPGAVSLGGLGGNFGPLAGETDFTLVQRTRRGEGETAIAIKGAAGFGLGAKSKLGPLEVGVGGACYPSTGAAYIYPRALFKDAVAYYTAPATPPRGRTR